jgi:hypothetical protein
MKSRFALLVLTCLVPGTVISDGIPTGMGIGLGTGVGSSVSVAHSPHIALSNGQWGYVSTMLCGTVTSAIAGSAGIPVQDPGPNNIPPFATTNPLLSDGFGGATSPGSLLAFAAPGTYMATVSLVTPQPGQNSCEIRVNGVLFQGSGTVRCSDTAPTFTPTQELTYNVVTAACNEQADMTLTQSLKSTDALGAAVALSTEEPSTFSAFFDCIDGPNTSAGPTWVETANLLLTNSSGTDSLATGVFLDGNGNYIAQMPLDMAARDVDEINLCRTLDEAGVDVPLKGHMIVYRNVGSPTFDFNCWLVDYVGKFYHTVNEPSKGRVVGVGKTQCMETNIDRDLIVAELNQLGVPVVSPIILNNSTP